MQLRWMQGREPAVVEYPEGSRLELGSAPDCALHLLGEGISPRHARLTLGVEGALLEDLGSNWGTAVLRAGERITVGDGSFPLALQDWDIIELGGLMGPPVAALQLEPSREDAPQQILAVRPMTALGGGSQTDRLGATLQTLRDAQERIAKAVALSDVLRTILDTSLDVVRKATHATLILRESPDELGPDAQATYVPILTRVRHADGSLTEEPTGVMTVRSVFRQVIRDRAAILAADAPSGPLGTESLLGASIRSTLAVPLWQGEQVLGVLQLDNRDAPGMFARADVDALGLLAGLGSLALAKTRLIHRLMQLEQELRHDNAFLRRRAGEPGTTIIGNSRAMKELSSQLDRVAVTRVSVLIEGETGVGKELVAHAVHRRSPRAERLFIAQNCAALPEQLLESELFGHRRGSFTGATEDKRGLFEMADGGTLFLDEVTEMPLNLQAKLLRALQEGEVRPLGAQQTRKVNVRIVAATNRKLEGEVAAGRFREDLYYRLNVFPVRVPPLRERRDDIPLLADHFLRHYSLEFGKPVLGFGPGVLELLASHDWPGNVRELENEVQRMVIDAEPDGPVLKEHCSQRLTSELTGTPEKADVGSLKERVERFERRLLLESLAQHDQNKSATARTLGITREGLHKKLKTLGLG